MLELRPTCEHCNTLLPPDALNARICSYECTFCAECAETILGNVCPNCGGGFVPRPIRPARNWKKRQLPGQRPGQRHSEIPSGRPRRPCQLQCAAGGCTATAALSAAHQTLLAQNA